MEQIKMLIQKITSEEIQEIRNLLDECQSLSEELQHTPLEDVDFSEFNVLELEKPSSSNYEILQAHRQFIKDLLAKLANLSYELAIINLLSLLDFCTNPDVKHLEFSTQIKQGLQALENLKSKTL